MAVRPGRLAAMTVATRFRIVLALQPARHGDVLTHHRGHHPAPTAIASRPSRTSAITSLIATVTEAGAPGAVAAASIAG